MGLNSIQHYIVKYKTHVKFVRGPQSRFSFRNQIEHTIDVIKIFRLKIHETNPEFVKKCNNGFENKDGKNIWSLKILLRHSRKRFASKYAIFSRKLSAKFSRK